MDLKNYNPGNFDRGASRIKEALWYATKILFFLNSLPFPSRVKAALLRLFGAEIGAGLVIRPRVNISFPWRLTIGDHVWIGEEVLILSLARVTIGSNVCISQRAFLCTGSHDHRKPGFDLITKPIVIESGSWVGAQAFVGPGVTVGPGSVVGAGAVVARDVPPGSLARGNPATTSAIENADSPNLESKSTFEEVNPVKNGT